MNPCVLESRVIEMVKSRLKQYRINFLTDNLNLRVYTTYDRAMLHHASAVLDTLSTAKLRERLVVIQRNAFYSMHWCISKYMIMHIQK